MVSQLLLNHFSICKLTRCSFKTFARAFASGSSGAGEYCVAFVTVPDVDAAKEMAHELIEKKLAACVNIIPEIISIHEWKGEMSEEENSQLVIKTRASVVDKLAEYVNSKNHYELNEVVSLPIRGGNPLYLKWIGEQVPV